MPPTILCLRHDHQKHGTPHPLQRERRSGSGDRFREGERDSPPLGHSVLRKQPGEQIGRPEQKKTCAIPILNIGGVGHPGHWASHAGNPERVDYALSAFPPQVKVGKIEFLNTLLELNDPVCRPRAVETGGKGDCIASTLVVYLLAIGVTVGGALYLGENGERRRRHDESYVRNLQFYT